MLQKKDVLFPLSLQSCCKQKVEDLKTRGQKIRLFQVCFIFFTRSYTSKKLCEISILCSNLCKSILDGMCNGFQEIIKTEWTTFLDAPGGTDEVMQGAQVRGCPFNAKVKINTRLVSLWMEFWNQMPTTKNTLKISNIT